MEQRNSLQFNNQPRDARVLPIQFSEPHQYQRRFSLNVQELKPNEIRKMGPFADLKRDTFTQVNQYIVDNRGQLLNRHDRTRIPIYMKTGTRVLENEQSQVRLSQTHVRLNGFNEIKRRPSLIERARGYVYDFMDKVFGTDYVTQRISGFDRKYTHLVDEDIDTFDPVLERVKPLNINNIKNTGNTLMNVNIYQNQKVDPDIMEIDDDHEQSFQPFKSRASRIPLYRPQPSTSNEYVLGKRSTHLEHKDTEELENDAKEQHGNKRQKLAKGEVMLLKKLQSQQMQKIDEVNSSIMTLKGEVTSLKNTIDDKFLNLKEQIVHEISNEMKDSVLRVWRDGTDRFYNDAKSVVSNYSIHGTSSVISDLSRSRSGSKDFMMTKQVCQQYNNNNSQQQQPKQAAQLFQSKAQKFANEDDFSDQDYSDAKELQKKQQNTTYQKETYQKEAYQKETFKMPYKQSKGNMLQQPAMASDQREGAISPIQQVGLNQQSNVQFTLNNEGNKNEGGQEFNQSPAFGVSSNKKEMKLTDKAPDDKSILKPVAIKPSLQFTDISGSQEEKNKIKDTAPASQSLYQESEKKSVDNFKSNLFTLPQGIFSEQKGGLFEGAVQTQIKEQEQKKPFFPFGQNAAEQIKDQNKLPAEEVKPNNSLFSSTTSPLNQGISNTKIPGNLGPSNSSALFGGDKSTKTSGSSLFTNKEAEKDGPQSSLFTANKESEKTQSTLFGNKESEKQTTQGSLLSNKPQGTFQDKVEQKVSQPIYSNPILSAVTTQPNNPFTNPIKALLSFGNAIQSQAEDKTQKEQQLNRPDEDQLEIRASKSDMSIDDVKQQQSEITSDKQAIQTGSLFENQNKPQSSLFNANIGAIGQGSLFAAPPVQSSLFNQTPAQNQSTANAGFAAFGQANQGSTAFAQSSSNISPQKPGASLFGQPTSVLQGASLFGQLPSTTTTNPSAFGIQAQPINQGSAFGQQSIQNSQMPPFGQVKASSNAFGGAQQQNSLFTGQQNAFTQNAPNAFGQTPQIFNQVINSANQINQAPKAPVFGNTENLFGTPTKDKGDDGDGLFQFGSASKNTSAKKKK